MKQNAAVNFVETNMTGATEFKIKASSKAFKILSSGIYKDKIKAVIREISCNAYDAHVAAGNQATPIEVHLPSRFEPWFSVRDFGTGMDDAKIKKLYTTYFDSTKDQSNDFVGALGIGSKSPFSYTDSYTVTAWDGAKKRTYTCFIGEDGTPAILKLGTETCTDPRGIEVRIAVKDADVSAFKEKAGSVYYWFDVLPAGLPTDFENFKTDKEVSHEIAKTYIVNRSNSYNRGNGLSIRMGQVNYPLEVQPSEHGKLMDVKYKGNHVQYSIKDALQSNSITSRDVCFNVEIGEVDMTASREDLEYTETTNKCVAALLASFMSNSITHLLKGIEECESYDEAAFIYNRNPILQNGNSEVKWKDLSLKDNKIVNKRLFANNKFGKFIRIFDLEKSKNAKDIGLETVFNRNKRMFFLIKDEPVKFLYPRFNQYKNDNKDSTYFSNKHAKSYCIFDNYYYNDGSDSTGIYYVQIASTKIRKLFMAVLKKAGINHMMTSQLPDLRDAPVRKTIEHNEVFRYADDASCRSRTIIDVDNGNGYYIENSEDLSHDMHHIIPILNAMKKVGYITNHAVHVIPKRLSKEIKANPKWENIKECLTTLTDRFIKDCETTWKQDIQDQLDWQDFQNACNHSGELMRVLQSRDIRLHDLSKKFQGQYGGSTQSYDEAQEKKVMYDRLKPGNNIFTFSSYSVRVSAYKQQNPILKVFEAHNLTHSDKEALVTRYAIGVF